MLDLNLTPRERVCGHGVRVVGCVRANDANIAAPASGFLWSVCVLRRGVPGEPLVRPRLTFCSRIEARRFDGTGEPVFLGSYREPFDGEPWSVYEYELFLPAGVRAFTVTAGGDCCHVSREECARHIDHHFLEIRNAFADRQAYPAWLNRHRAMLAREVPTPQPGPLMSIVTPVFCTPPDYLRAMIDSVVAQTYVNWELVLVNASPNDQGVAAVLADYDDERIHVVDCPQNRGIVGNTNLGIEAATGDYVSFLDHDDFLEPQALAAFVNAIEASNEPVDLLYCDEDSYDGTEFCLPIFKPALNRDLLCSNNYVLHWLTVSRSALQRTSRTTSDLEGAQDYDLTFRVLELGGRALRVPYVLYHWRLHAGSTNSNTDSKPYAQEAGRRAIEQHLARRGVAATVAREATPSTYRVTYRSDSHPSMLAFCSLAEKDLQPVRSLLAAYTQTTGVPATLFDSVLPVDLAGCDVALVITRPVDLGLDALLELLAPLCRPEVAAVAPRVLRRDGLVQSSGCDVGPTGELVRLGRLLPGADEGYIGRNVRPLDASVLDPTCCALRADVWREALAEVKDEIPATSDDLAQALLRACRIIRGAGRLNLYNAFAVCTLAEHGPMLWEQPFVAGPAQRQNPNVAGPYYRLV
jgi:hypothetical protein